MPTRQIIALSVLVVFAILFFLSLQKMKKTSKKRSTRRGSSRSRESDKRRLNRYERKAYDQAIALHREGKSIPAAQLLESIGMMRESISVLESSGNIKEAAGTLLRMQKPNRAGVILARHKKWGEAAQCFITAGMHLEAAKCFREVQDYNNAGEHFAKAQRFEDSAECFCESGDYGRAAKIFAKLNTRAKYIDALRKLYEQRGSFDNHPFDSNQVEIINDYLVDPENPFFPGFLQAFTASDQMASLILTLLENGREREAGTAYLAFEQSCDDDLLINVNYVKEQAPRLAKLMRDHEQYDKAAIVFTRLENFKAAAECFERAGDLQSAISYYDKVGDEHKIAELRKSMAKGRAATPPPPPKLGKGAPKKGVNPFSLQSVEVTSTDAKGATFGSERTEVLTNPDAIKSDKFQVSKYEGDDEDTKVVFQRLEFLDELSHAEKELLWAVGQERKFNVNQDILDLHEEPEGIVFILRGQVSIEISDHGKMVPIKTLESTESFGESWVLADQESPFMAMAKTACHLFIVPKSELITLMNENGEIARKLYRKYTLSLLSKMVTPSNNMENKAAS